MSLSEEREFIQVQILETDRLLELAGDHPLMSPALQQRKAEFERELKELECQLDKTEVTQGLEPDRGGNEGRSG